MTIYARSLRAADPDASLPLAAACGLLDTDQPNIIDPGDIDSPSGATGAPRSAPSPTSPSPRTATGPQFEDGLILVGGLHGRRVRALHHAAVAAGDRPAHDRRRSTPTLSDVYRNLHQARVGARDRGRSRCGSSLVTPDETPDIAEMQALAGFTYIYFGETFCSGVPFSRVSGDSLIFGDPQTTAEMFDTRARLVRRGTGRARALGRRRDHHQSRDRWAGRGPCSIWAGSPTRPRRSPPCPPSSSTPPSMPTARSGCRTPSGRTPIRASGRCRMSRGVRAAVPHGGGHPGPGGQPIDEETGEVTPGWTSSPRKSTCSSTQTPTRDVPVADGIEARLIEAEAQLQASDSRRHDHHPQRPCGRASGPRPASIPPGTQAEGSTCCSASGHSGSSPPATAWATCAA